jgi:hypothetical protein
MHDLVVDNTAYCTTIVLAINRRSNYYKTTIMYTRIGILGRARQAIGIARLHAPKEALYIDIKYNSHSHSHSAQKARTSKRILPAVRLKRDLGAVAC